MKFTSFYFANPVDGEWRRAVAAIEVLNRDSRLTESIAFAVCSTKDRFSKKMGQRIAEGRLKKGDSFVMVTDLGTKSHRAWSQRYGEVNAECSFRSFLEMMVQRIMRLRAERS